MPRGSGGRLGRSTAVGMGLCLLAVVSEGQGRRGDASAAFVGTRYSQFEEFDPGFGVALSYRLTGFLAADAQLAYFPKDLGPAAFSGSRTEALLGVRIGPRLGRSGVFAAVRPGFVRFGEAPEPRPCILIYPPPLTCSLAAGDTVFALNLGAGFEAFPGEKGVLRIELGDDVLRYSGPGFDKGQRTFEDHLWSHNLRVAASVGIRF